jgi:hypothetical protein
MIRSTSIGSLFMLVSVASAQPKPAEVEVEQLKKRVTQLEEEVRELRKLLEATKTGAPKPGVLVIRVPKDDWKAPPADIQAVCLSAANEIWKHTSHRTIEPITMTYSTKGPMVVYGLGGDGDRRVLLNVQGTYWSQFSYQFAHEFCHILCNYRDSTKQNHWFEESLCELASLFALRKMAETWKTSPPYPNWKSYSESLQSYIDDHIKKIAPLGDLTLAQWYVRNEEALRKNSTDRPKNEVVALALLPLFEKNPEHWAALEYLNRWEKTRELTFKEYLTDWHERVPEKHKSSVANVAKLFEIPLAK